LLKRPFTLAALLTSFLLAAFVFVKLAAAQTDSPRHFPETGHTVRDPFIHFFNTTGGLTRYGYPITDDYVDSQTGLLVQYFQRARLEWHPGNPDPYKIQLGLLGDELGKRTPPLLVSQIPLVSDPNCQYFPETGHSTCLKFLEYWRRNGGLDGFGYPITEYSIENDQIVQYFQRGKMEWHPEKSEGQRVQLAPVGQIYYDYAQLDRNRLKANPLSASLGQVTSLRARGSVLSAVTPRTGTQTGFVYVSDQLGNPITGAAVTLVVHYPKGDQSFTLPPTSASGATFLTFGVGQVTPGTVVPMEFVVTYSGMFTRTRTSYMVWFY